MMLKHHLVSIDQFWLLILINFNILNDNIINDC